MKLCFASPHGDRASAGAGLVSLRGLDWPWLVGDGWSNSSSLCHAARTEPSASLMCPLEEVSGGVMHPQNPRKDPWPRGPLWTPCSSQPGL